MAKPGRKRKQGVKREASGRVQRPNAQNAAEEAMSVAMGYRARVFGIRPSDLKNQMAESFVGRLCIGKELSPVQYDAAMTFLADHRNMAAAIQAPRDPSGLDFNRVHGAGLAEENVEQYERARRRWKGAVDAVQERQNELRGAGALYAALETCVLRDVQATHMVGWLREGLNALVRHYGLGERVRAA